MPSPKTMTTQEEQHQQTIDSTAAAAVERPVTQSVNRDRFAAPEYVNHNARLPRIQALRGENGASECGYFITETEMAKAGWREIDESQTIVYEYNSGVRLV
jgi:hypothetical protein